MLKLLLGDSPSLQRPSKPVAWPWAIPDEFFDEMFAVMEYGAPSRLDGTFRRPGVGLAAPQVGVNRRIIVINYRGLRAEVVNPVLVKTPGKLTTSIGEGCLSFPGQYRDRRRHKRVVVEGMDRHGKLLRFDVRGTAAFIFQHEIDHLNGVIFL